MHSVSSNYKYIWRYQIVVVKLWKANINLHLSISEHLQIWNGVLDLFDRVVEMMIISAHNRTLFYYN